DGVAPSAQPSAKPMPVAAKSVRQVLKTTAEQPASPKGEVAEAAPSAPSEQTAETPALPAPQLVTVNIPE
ncbi:MAG: hypothetical protein IJ586_07325, partial [Alloprevotella sp.]|nr:hypothetical protein [Alloprevotella sp.]